MYHMLLDSSTYQQTCDIKLGNIQLEPLFQELVNNLKEKFDVEMLNYVFDYVDQTPRLNIILNTTNQYRSMLDSRKGHFGFKKKDQQEIANHFATIVMNDVQASQMYNTQHLFVCFTDFQKEAMCHANLTMLENHREELLSTYKDHNLWNIIGMFTSATFFYMTNNDVKEHNESGHTADIKGAYFTLVKRYDQFDYYAIDKLDLFFDSKENLDKDYDGNLYAYFK